MKLQQLIKKWTKEMAELKVEIQDYENKTGKSAILATARLQAISEILADVKQLNLPPVIKSVCEHDYQQMMSATGIDYFQCKKYGKEQ